MLRFENLRIIEYRDSIKKQIAKSYRRDHLTFNICFIANRNFNLEFNLLKRLHHNITEI